MTMRIGILMVAAVFGVMGCKDRAEPDYQRCVQLEQKSDLQAAHDACVVAKMSDPNSKSGKLAAQKLTDMQPALDTLKKKKADEEAKAAAERAEQSKKQALLDAEARKNAAAACHEKCQDLWARCSAATLLAGNDFAAEQCNQTLQECHVECDGGRAAR